MNFFDRGIKALTRIISSPFKDDPIKTIEKELQGRNAYNEAGLVVLNKGLKYRAAVWAQEAYEAELKLNIFEALALRLDKDRLREMELFSHEIEVKAAVAVYEVEEVSYRLKEATTLSNGYDGLFKDYTVALINKVMKEEYGIKAGYWVHKNIDRIKAQM